MLRTTVHAIAFMIVFALLSHPALLTYGQDRNAAVQPPLIHVQGRSSIDVVADQVVLRFFVETENVEINVAREENSKQVHSIIDFLHENKVKPGNIQTVNISVGIRRFASKNQKSPVQQDPFETQEQTDGETSRRFSVQRNLTVRIDSMDRIESIYSGLVERGVERFDQIKYETNQWKELEKSTQLQAVQNARETALRVAHELKSTIKSVQRIHVRPSVNGTESRDHSVSMDPFGDSDESPRIMGMVTVSTTVEVDFELDHNDGIE